MAPEAAPFTLVRNGYSTNIIIFSLPIETYRIFAVLAETENTAYETRLIVSEREPQGRDYVPRTFGMLHNSLRESNQRI